MEMFSWVNSGFTCQYRSAATLCALILAAERKRMRPNNQQEAVIVTAKPTLILVAFAQMFCISSFQAQSPKVIGSWKVEITFGNSESRSFRFEAGESGKASFLLLDPRSKYWGPARPSEAKWTQGPEGSVTFSGPVEFPLGNVGRDAGTLVLTGKLGTDGSITGEAKFFPLDQDPKDPKASPSKSGRFKATRATG